MSRCASSWPFRTSTLEAGVRRRRVAMSRSVGGMFGLPAEKSGVVSRPTSTRKSPQHARNDPVSSAALGFDVVQGPPSHLFGCRQRGGERGGAEKAHGNGEEEGSGPGRVVDGGTSHQSDPRANGPGNFFLRGPRRGFSWRRGGGRRSTRQGRRRQSGSRCRRRRRV